MEVEGLKTQLKIAEEDKQQLRDDIVYGPRCVVILYRIRCLSLPLLGFRASCAPGARR